MVDKIAASRLRVRRNLAGHNDDGDVRVESLVLGLLAADSLNSMRRYNRMSTAHHVYVWIWVADG